MKTLDDLRPSIGRTLSEMDAEAASARDPNMEGRPAERARLAEAARLRAAWRAQIAITQQLAAKRAARVDQLRGLRTAVVGADCAGRAEASTTEAERRAWLDTDRYFREGVGYEMPGGVAVLCRELNVTHLPTLPTLDAMLSEAESDLQVHVELLRVALDAWDRRALTVRGTVNAELPAVQATATVK